MSLLLTDDEITVQGWYASPDAQWQDPPSYVKDAENRIKKLKDNNQHMVTKKKRRI